MASPNTSIDAQMMTLAGIAYGGDNHPTDPTSAKNGIDFYLNHPGLATSGKWSRVWGPIVTDTQNLVFIAQAGSEFAVVIRGTVMTWDSWKRDVPTSQSHFPGAPSGALVSSEFLGSQIKMLQALGSGPTAPSDVTLVEFLKAQNMTKLYVTGHSQGGGLTPMMYGALGQIFDCPIAAYGFAPPTSGNPDFANWVGQQKNNTLSMYINPCDVVPLGYNHMRWVYEKGIPIDIPLLSTEGIAVRAAVDVAQELTDPDIWQQPDSQVTLPKIPIIPITPGQSFFDKLKAAVEAQHAHNNYLALMKATQLPPYPPQPQNPKKHKPEPKA